MIVELGNAFIAQARATHDKAEGQQQRRQIETARAALSEIDEELSEFLTLYHLIEAHLENAMCIEMQTAIAQIYKELSEYHMRSSYDPSAVKALKTSTQDVKRLILILGTQWKDIVQMSCAHIEGLITVLSTFSEYRSTLVQIRNRMGSAKKAVEPLPPTSDAINGFFNDVREIGQQVAQFPGLTESVQEFLRAAAQRQVIPLSLISDDVLAWCRRHGDYFAIGLKST